MSITETTIKVANNRWITSGQPFWCASVAALLVALVVWPYVPAGMALTAFGVLILADRQLAAMRWYFWRDETHDQRANYWERWLIAGNVFAGVIWGSVSALLYLQIPADAAPLIGLIVAVVIGGRSLSYVPSIKCIQGFSIPVALAMVIAVLIEGDPRHYVVGLVILLILLVVLRHARIISRTSFASVEKSSVLKIQAENETRRSAEIALEYERLRQFMDALPVPIIVSTQAGGLVVYLNQLALDLLGIKSLSQGQTFHSRDFYANPDDRDMIVKKITEGGEMSAEFQIKRTDGTLFWGFYALNKIVYEGEPAFAGVVMDFSARRKAQDELRTSEVKFRMLADHANDLITLYTLEGVCTYVSPSVKRLLGYGVDEFMAVTARQVVHREDIKHISAANTQSMETGGIHRSYTYRMLHKSGHWEWLDASSSIDSDPVTGKYFQVATVSRLVTDRVRQEQELKEALIRAEASDRAKSDFLAHMSHEIRTPLNAVIGFSEVMRDELFGPLGSARYLDYINDIHSSGTHLLGLINEVLDLSKIEAGKMELQEDRVCLETIVVTAFRFLRERAHGKQIMLRSQLHAAPDLWGDRRVLTQVLLNVIGNAIKFTPELGSVTVESYADPAGDLVLTVTDTGIGIAPEDISVVMKPFGQVRISSELATAEPGTGLGLPLSESFVKKHGGTFSITSEIGIGTRVTITIPASRVMHDDDERDFESAAF
ncbi:MAG: PAS domain-containing sensor histidine kinase [Alphaproteobacteria bacterium]